MTVVDPKFSHLGPLGRTALRAMEITDRLVKKAKTPGFSLEEWDELAALVAVDEFRRVAANRESRDWHEDITLRHQFAVVCDFTYEIRRIAESGNVVYVDLIETITAKDGSFSVNTLGVMEFNEAGKLLRNTTYQQWDPDRVPTHVGRQD
jgi:hypothetical protein